MNPKRFAPTAALFAASALVLVAGAAVSPQLGVVAGKATAVSSALTLYPQSGDELVMRIPVTQGWAPASLIPSDGSYPSDRAIVANVAVRDSGYSPTMILSVDQLDPDQPATGYAEQLSARFSQVSDRLDGAAGEACGRPAYLMEFSGMSSGGSDANTQSGMGIVVIPDGGSHAYIAVLQTRNISSPGYLAQRDAMLSGFCVGN